MFYYYSSRVSLKIQVYTLKLLSFNSFSTSLLQPNNTWTKTHEKTVNCFAQYFHSAFTPHSVHNPFHSDILNYLNDPLENLRILKPFTTPEIKFIIDNLPSTKAPGYDLITYQILSRLPKKALHFLTYLYNSVLRTTHFPTLWKFSIVIMIHKPTKHIHSPSSYWTISLLPILGKVLEKILFQRLYPIINSSSSIPDHQFGFWQHSTTHQCHRLHSWEEAVLLGGLSQRSASFR